MRHNITLLEKRIAQAVERLRELRAERDRFRDELEALRRRPGQTGKEGPGRSSETKRKGSDFDSSEVVTVLRQAIAELRDD